MLFRFKIKDTEFCPCGSNVQYKDCCKRKKVASPSPTKKPTEILLMERMRKSMERCCLHPDQTNCKGKIKEAHALQNNKIISLLAGENRHVFMLDAKKQPVLIPLKDGTIIPFVKISKISANKATTETCFCDLHDNIAFAAIEKGAPDFDGSEIMKFTYAYKAFIFEYYKELIGIKIFRKCFKENPQAFQSKQMIAMYRMLQLKEKEFEPIKVFFDEQIMQGTCNGVFTYTIKIPEQIKFATYAYIAPNYDMNGRKIKHTKHRIMHRMALTIFPEKTKSWLLLSCLENEREIYEPFFKQLKEASLNKLKFYLNLILPLYSENMVLSPELWESWSKDIQMAYTYYANLNGSYAMDMDRCLRFALKNASKSKKKSVYNTVPKINLFS